MTLTTQKRLIRSDEGTAEEIVVACPQRIDPVPLTECARCELCLGLELDAQVRVRCLAEPDERGAAGAGASIATIMTSPVVSVEQDASIENVQWLLLDRGIGAVPVVDRHQRLIGILAKTDLLRDRDEPTVSVHPRARERERELGSSERTVNGLTAFDLMTPVVHVVHERASIASTAALMCRERVHHIVLLSESGGLSGIVSTFDIVRWVAARERFARREE